MVVRKGKSKRKSFIRKSNRLRQKIYRTKSKTRKNNKKRNTRKKNTKKKNKRNTKKNNTKKNNSKKKRLIGGASTSSTGGTHGGRALVQYFSDTGLSRNLNKYYYVRLRYPGSVFKVWEPDRYRCFISNIELGKGNRHHCRHCGMSVSTQSSQERLRLDRIATKENGFVKGCSGQKYEQEIVMVCDLCYSLPRFVVKWTKVDPGGGADILIGPGKLVFPKIKHSNYMITCDYIDSATGNVLTYRFPEANLRPTRMFCGITINDLKARTLEGKCVPIQNPKEDLRYTYDHVPVYAFCAMEGKTPHELGAQTYEEILARLNGNNGEIESADKLIQFLFPIQQPSRYSEVPNVSSDEIVYLRNNPIFRQRLSEAKGIMLTFYLRLVEPNWNRHLTRITRILKCLSMFEGEASAQNFLDKINGPEGTRERATLLYPEPGQGADKVRDKVRYETWTDRWGRACYEHTFNELIQVAVDSVEGNLPSAEVQEVGTEPDQDQDQDQAQAQGQGQGQAPAPAPVPDPPQVDETEGQSAEDESGSDGEEGLLSTRNCDGEHMCGKDEVCSCPQGKECPPENKVCVDMTKLDSFI
jgi:hypothetical protein